MEYKGEIFELGKLYRFKNNGPYDWVIGELVAIDPDGFPTCSVNGDFDSPFDMICVIDADELGNIVQKPVELINGNGYAFDCRGQRHIGLFCYAEHRMITTGVTFGADECSNIVELVEKNHE